MIEHISAPELDADDIVDRFTVDPSRLLAARRVWAMFWLRLLLSGGRAATRNPPGAADRHAQRLLTLRDP